MTTNPFLERRTRSQIRLSDDVLKVPEHSPMKNARNIARLRSEPPEDRRFVDDSEDELLSSNRPPNPLGSKRSVSPPATDEYSIGASNDIGRQLKRMKWDSSEGETRSSIGETNHARIHSEPNLGPSQRVSYKRVATVSPRSKPNSTSNLPKSETTQSLTELTSKTRAQSVPLFPSFSSLPLLDLRKLPLSPIRARSPSHSPDKYHGLKVYPSPRKSPTPGPPQAEVVVDEHKASMEVDEDSIPLNPAMTESSMAATTSVLEVSVLPPKSPALLPPPVDSSTKFLATPLPGGLGFDLPMSPLSPLPETPLPQALIAEGENRHNTKENWTLPPEKDSEASSSLQPIPRPDFGKPESALNASGVPKSVSRSQIPRPSVGPPLRLLEKPIPTTEEKGKSSIKMMAHKGSSSSSRPNAFTFLMKNAAKQGETKQSKDKAKGIAALQKIKAATKSNDAKAKEKAEPQVRRIPLKDRMRRNKNPKPLAPTKFEPVIFDEDDDQEVVAKLETKEISSTPAEEIPASGEAVPHAEPIVSKPLPLEEFIATPSPSSITQPIVEAENSAVPRTSSPPLTAVYSLSNFEPGINAPVDIQERPTTLPAIVPEGQVEHGEEVRSASIPAELTIPAEPKQQDPLSEELNVEVPEMSVDKQIRPTPQLEIALNTSTEQVAQHIGPKPITRKRARSIVPSSNRVTRSAMRPPQPPSKPTAGRRPRANTTTSISREASAPPATKKSPSKEQTLSPGSPMQINSPAYKESRTPGSSPAKISLAKTPSKPRFSMDGSPSPTKIARAVSMFRRPSTDDIGVKPNGSSLSTLSNALEKLKMPVPPRPSTSLGFNPDKDGDIGDDDDDMMLSGQLQGPGLLGKNSIHQRSLTVGAVSSKNQAGPSTGKPRLVQKPMTNFFAKSGSSLSNPRSAKNQLLGSGKTTLGGFSAKGKGKALFGIGGSSGVSGGLFPMASRRLGQKVSKKSSLPVVEGSPVKGGMTHDIVMDDPLPPNDERSEKADEGAKTVPTDLFTTPPANMDGETLVVGSSGDINSISGGKDKEKDNREKAWKKDSSRRASLALSQLSQSLSAAPGYGKGSMGPPVTPRKVARSASSTYPTTSTTNDVASEGTKTPKRSSKSPDKAGPHVIGTRFSARQAAKTVANPESQSPPISTGTEVSVKTSGEKKKKDNSMSARKTEALNILNGCVIFVDVKTDDGEEAGSLFVEMLESLGARLLARVGQTCTHIVFKNGLMSTISRYRLLRDPKPSVVGIAWVVDCVEQRRRVEEAPYLIDLKAMNVAGTNKRRRSMLPKLISYSSMESTPTEVDPQEAAGDADVSMDGSTSSLTLDDEITPLERARRRRSMIFGPA